jgi:DNA-binding CsgD family transcriptional regulator
MLWLSLAGRLGSWHRRLVASPGRRWALKAGAAGFLVKTESPERLVHAVRVVAAGEALLAPEITRRLIDRFLAGLRPNTPAPPELAELTERELEVLQLVARGLSNAEIGAALFVSDGTVKTHVAHILTKLALRDRVQVVVFATSAVSPSPACGESQPHARPPSSTCGASSPSSRPPRATSRHAACGGSSVADGAAIARDIVGLLVPPRRDSKDTEEWAPPRRRCDAEDNRRL